MVLTMLWTLFMGARAADFNYLVFTLNDGSEQAIVATGINASYNTTTNGSGDLTVSGGYLYVISSGNDAMDANGNFYVKGGFVYAVGTGNPEKSLDANTEQGKKLYVSGGTNVSLSNYTSSSGGGRP